MNILFICGKARQRSPTAAEIAARLLRVQTDFAGLSADADERLGPEQIDWADIVVVMEKAHLARLRRQFGGHLGGRRVVCLDIADRYTFMQPELVQLLERRLGRLQLGASVNREE